MGGFIGDALNFATLGLTDALGLTGDNIKADNTAAAQLQEDRKRKANRRKALYSTAGGSRGEEVFGVGNNGRGNVFGN